MATKQARRRDLDVHLGTEGRLIERLYLRSGKRSAFRYAPHVLVEVAAGLYVALRGGGRRDCFDMTGREAPYAQEIMALWLHGNSRNLVAGIVYGC